MTAGTTRPVAPQVERRVYAIRGLEVRAARDTDGAIPMTGYASVFGARSHVLWDWFEGAFVEEVERGAFAKSIADGDVRLLMNHNPDLILARTRATTLRLSEDDTGLRVDADIAPTSVGQDLAISMRRGDVTQMSFGFHVVRDAWSLTEDGMPLRRLQEIKLYDVSTVTFPAYEATEAQVRGLQFQTEEQLATMLTDLISREPTPQRLPVLRAARTALEARLATLEPHEQHSNDLAARELRMRGLAARFGLPGAVQGE